MPQFKHRVTGVTREWRTDNEDVFRRLHKLGWRRVEEAPVEVKKPEPVPIYTEALGWPEWVNDTQRMSLFNAGLTFRGLQEYDDKFALVNRLVSLHGIGKATAQRLVWGVD